MNKDIELKLGKLLKQNSQTISCAESCTGGYISHLLTKHSGSSSFFIGGIIAYQNEVKQNILGVNSEDLINFGAVSKNVVEQMALGVKKIMNTDWAVATSGIAGPNGGTKEKPVGTVWIAWAGSFGVKSKLFQLGNNRGLNIESAANIALSGLLKIIED